MSFEDIKKAIAKVIAENRPCGTAFYVGDDYVLTALHVVADITATPPVFASKIELNFHFLNEHKTEATIVQHLYDVTDDWVVLRCKTPPEIAPLQLGTTPNMGNKWLSFGYPGIQVAGIDVRGAVNDTNASLKMNGNEIAPERVIHLGCDEAKAGNGVALHGLSGAPCLVDDLVVGIIRCGLEEEVIDGMKVPKLYSVAGSIYATHANRVIEKQKQNQMRTLSGTWVPEGLDIPDLNDCDFLVLFSQQEPNQDSNDQNLNQESNNYLTLRSVVESSYYDRLTKMNINLTTPCFYYASEMIRSTEHLENCISVLCRAKVVVFDMTDFEPAIMFFAGIRAVVRRGVTVLSVGKDYYLGKQLQIPFNISDANIIAHSVEQDARTESVDSISLLTERIRNGLANMNKADYLDLSVYDAIRKLPSDRRGIIPSEEGILVLCPFSDGYNEFWEKKLKYALAAQLKSLRQNNLNTTAKLGVARSFELNSPRLVTHAVYEHIRRVQSCVVDLTGWSANVLFELGVRLVASGELTACIIDKNWDNSSLKSWQKEQYGYFVSHFVPETFRYDPALMWQKQQNVFRNAFPKLHGNGLLSGRLHKFVEQKLDIDSEPASQPIYQELLDQAAIFSRDQESSGKTKPVGLYPGNASLVELEAIADFERLLASFFFICNRYELAYIFTDSKLIAACDELHNQLYARHSERLKQNPFMKENLDDKWQKIKGH